MMDDGNVAVDSAERFVSPGFLFPVASMRRQCTPLYLPTGNTATL